MPFYDYKCKDCDFIFEIRHGMSEEPKIACEKCESKNTEKIIRIFTAIDTKPAWESHEDIKRYVNKMNPKRLYDEKSGKRIKMPKGGV